MGGKLSYSVVSRQLSEAVTHSACQRSHPLRRGETHCSAHCLSSFSSRSTASYWGTEGRQLVPMEGSLCQCALRVSFGIPDHKILQDLLSPLFIEMKVGSQRSTVHFKVTRPAREETCTQFCTIPKVSL